MQQSSAEQQNAKKTRRKSERTNSTRYYCPYMWKKRKKQALCRTAEREKAKARGPTQPGTVALYDKRRAKAQKRADQLNQVLLHYTSKVKKKSRVAVHVSASLQKTTQHFLCIFEEKNVCISKK
jgi:hypothetical protein